MSSSAKPSSAVGKAGLSPKRRRSKSPTKPESPGKGKGKVTSSPRRRDDPMDEDDEDDDEEEENGDDDDDDDEDEDDAMEEEDDDDDDEDDDGGDEIDPGAILPRRTRGTRVNYTSTAALEKAGLNPENQDEDDAA